MGHNAETFLKLAYMRGVLRADRESDVSLAAHVAGAKTAGLQLNVPYGLLMSMGAGAGLGRALNITSPFTPMADYSVGAGIGALTYGAGRGAYRLGKYLANRNAARAVGDAAAKVTRSGTILSGIAKHLPFALPALALGIGGGALLARSLGREKTSAPSYAAAIEEMATHLPPDVLERTGAALKTMRRNAHIAGSVIGGVSGLGLGAAGTAALLRSKTPTDMANTMSPRQWAELQRNIQSKTWSDNMGFVPEEGTV